MSDDMDIDADTSTVNGDDDNDDGDMNDEEEMNAVTDAFIAALTFILIKSCMTCGSSTPISRCSESQIGRCEELVNIVAINICGFDGHISAHLKFRAKYILSSMIAAGSKSLNPLTRGRYKRSRAHPCRPWLRGTHLQPKGDHCRLCEWNLVLGCFDRDCSTLQAVHAKQLQSQSFLREWKACLAKLIEYVNNGKITLRTRGDKKASQCIKQ